MFSLPYKSKITMETILKSFRNYNIITNKSRMHFLYLKTYINFCLWVKSLPYMKCQTNKLWSITIAWNRAKVSDFRRWLSFYFLRNILHLMRRIILKDWNTTLADIYVVFSLIKTCRHVKGANMSDNKQIASRAVSSVRIYNSPLKD